MQELSVHKDRIVVTVCFEDGEKVRGEIFLAHYSSAHQGHQKVSDLLEGEKEFVPLLLKGNPVGEGEGSSDGNLEFFNKHAAMMIEGEVVEKEDEEKFSLGLIHINKVKVLFLNGDSIEGGMLSEVPPERSRLSDCLNMPERFINFRREDRYLHLNKKMIKKVIGLSEKIKTDEPPPPTDEPA